jgi:hypothetical protein
MSEAADRRHARRLPFITRATLSQGRCTVQASVQDLSLDGLLLELADEVPGFDWAQPLTARIHLADDLSIDMDARLVHREGRRVGLHRERIDLDSITHLRRLVQLNMGDDTLLSRNLSVLWNGSEPKP